MTPWGSGIARMSHRTQSATLAIMVLLHHIGEVWEEAQSFHALSSVESAHITLPDVSGPSTRKLHWA